MKQPFLLAITFLILISFSCTSPDTPSEVKEPTQEQEAGIEDSCRIHLDRLIRSTNFQQYNINSDLNFYIDELSGGFVRIKVFEKTEVREHAPIGWIEIHLAENTIKDVTIDPENPQVLSYDSLLFMVYKKCLGFKEDAILQKKLIPEQKKIDPSEAYILNTSGGRILDKPEGASVVVLPFNAKVEVQDTIGDWIGVLVKGKKGYIRESEIHPISMPDIESGKQLSPGDVYKKYLGTLGEMIEFSKPYELSYTFTSSKISIKKAYILLKLFMSSKERLVLPTHLPEGDFQQKKTDYDFDLKITNNKSNYSFTYQYPGGETVALIKQDSSGLITIQLTYFAD